MLHEVFENEFGLIDVGLVESISQDCTQEFGLLGALVISLEHPPESATPEHVPDLDDQQLCLQLLFFLVLGNRVIIRQVVQKLHKEHISNKNINNCLPFPQECVKINELISPNPKVIPPLLIFDHLFPLLLKSFIFFNFYQFEILCIIFREHCFLESMLHIACDYVLAGKLDILLDMIDCVLNRSTISHLQVLLSNPEILHGFFTKLVVSTVVAPPVRNGLDEGADQAGTHARLGGCLGHSGYSEGR